MRTLGVVAAAGQYQPLGHTPLHTACDVLGLNDPDSQGVGNSENGGQ
jgi:hypothetical protein